MKHKTTPNGFDARWVDCINGVLQDRENTDSRIADITDDLWESFIGPMIDHIEENIDCYETVEAA